MNWRALSLLLFACADVQCALCTAFVCYDLFLFQRACGARRGRGALISNTARMRRQHRQQGQRQWQCGALILVASDPFWFHQFSALMPASGHWLGRGAVRRRLGPRCPPPFPSVVRRAASLLRVSRGLCGFDPGFGVCIFKKFGSVRRTVRRATYGPKPVPNTVPDTVRTPYLNRTRRTERPPLTNPTPARQS